MNTFLLIASTIVGAFMAVTMIFVRKKVAERPASIKKIVLPPLFMSSGALMFLFPVFRISLSQVLEALSVGVVFSVFLILTSRFETRGGEIYLKPSRLFIGVLFGLLAFRVVFKLIIGQTISFGETSGMFFVLAFGMIVSWRIAMLYKYLRIQKSLETTKAPL
ncbi:MULTISPECIES: CcdC family protein [Salimicrobium]|uniref:Cytochrome c biogenesis protein CcdC n=2 Tax=Salimicrobium TaxID=351195 RepID=A0ABX4HP45_9BACI|nr:MULTISPECIES: cytochrome c biogenesis protein CcdC [Salimicrobium]PBB04599.1 cytochrome c biogenesis protein CcdC [Salimicrobium humidisoli]SIS65234.1 Membrane protein CcdC involved in cytochrome C biogenesis [Salimicrobium salexigens]